MHFFLNPFLWRNPYNNFSYSDGSIRVKTYMINTNTYNSMYELAKI